MNLASKICLSALSLAALATVSNGVTSFASTEQDNPKENVKLETGALISGGTISLNDMPAGVGMYSKVDESGVVEHGVIIDGQEVKMEDLTDEQKKEYGITDDMFNFELVEVELDENGNPIGFPEFSGEAINIDELSEEELKEMGIEIYEFHGEDGNSVVGHTVAVPSTPSN